MEEVIELFAGMTLAEYQENDVELAILSNSFNKGTYHDIPLALPELKSRLRTAINKKMNFEVAYKKHKLSTQE